MEIHCKLYQVANDVLYQGTEFLKFIWNIQIKRRWKSPNHETSATFNKGNRTPN